MCVNIDLCINTPIKLLYNHGILLLISVLKNVPCIFSILVLPVRLHILYKCHHLVRNHSHIDRHYLLITINNVQDIYTVYE